MGSIRRVAMRGTCLTVLGLSAATTAHAQNVGGVFGPEVTPNSKAAEFRAALAPSDGGAPTDFAARLHYQQTVTDDLRLRAVFQGQTNGPGGFDFAFAQFEAQWQIREDDQHGWDSALRLDLRLADDGIADQVGLNWTSDWYFGEKWFVRGIALTAIQFGENANNGLFLETRAGINYKLNDRYRLQLQSFNQWGSTANFAPLGDQNHVLGPAISGKLGGGWSFESSVLLGVTGAARDADFRIFLTRSF